MQLKPQTSYPAAHPQPHIPRPRQGSSGIHFLNPKRHRLHPWTTLLQYATGFGMMSIPTSFALHRCLRWLLDMTLQMPLSSSNKTTAPATITCRDKTSGGPRQKKDAGCMNQLGWNLHGPYQCGAPTVPCLPFPWPYPPYLCRCCHHFVHLRIRA